MVVYTRYRTAGYFRQEKFFPPVLKICIVDMVTFTTLAKILSLENYYNSQKFYPTKIFNYTACSYVHDAIECTTYIHVHVNRIRYGVLIKGNFPSVLLEGFQCTHNTNTPNYSCRYTFFP